MVGWVLGSVSGLVSWLVRSLVSGLVSWLVGPFVLVDCLGRMSGCVVALCLVRFVFFLVCFFSLVFRLCS